MRNKKVWVVVRKDSGTLVEGGRAVFSWFTLSEIRHDKDALIECSSVFATKKDAETWRRHWHNGDDFVTKSATLNF